MSTLQILTTWMSEGWTGLDWTVQTSGPDHSDLLWNCRFHGTTEQHANDKIECYELNINDLSVALEIRYFKYSIQI